MESIANLAQAKPGLLMHLQWFDFTLKDDYQHLCSMIPCSEGLELTSCRMSEPRSFAQAMATSSLQAIKFSDLQWGGHSETLLFLRRLAEDVSAMKSLQELDMEAGSMYDNGSKEALDDALSALVSATAHCPRLKTLRVRPWFFYPQSMDCALADCLKTNEQLETIVVECQCMPPYGSDSGLVSPAVLSALKTNYTVQEITFSPYEDEYYSWDADFCKNVGTLCRLNRSGRAYMATDDSSKAKGIQVLESVNDHLDCVWTHLCENPAIVCAAGLPSTPRSDRKRKAPVM